MKEIKEKYRAYKKKLKEAEIKAEELHKMAVKYVKEHPLPERPLTQNRFEGLISGNQFSTTAKKFVKPQEPHFAESAESLFVKPLKQKK